MEFRTEQDFQNLIGQDFKDEWLQWFDPVYHTREVGDDGRQQSTLVEYGSKKNYIKNPDGTLQENAAGSPYVFSVPYGDFGGRNLTKGGWAVGDGMDQLWKFLGTAVIAYAGVAAAGSAGASAGGTAATAGTTEAGVAAGGAAGGTGGGGISMGTVAQGASAVGGVGGAVGGGDGAAAGYDYGQTGSAYGGSMDGAAEGWDYGNEAAAAQQAGAAQNWQQMPPQQQQSWIESLGGSVANQFKDKNGNWDLAKLAQMGSGIYAATQNYRNSGDLRDWAKSNTPDMEFYQQKLRESYTDPGSYFKGADFNAGFDALHNKLQRNDAAGGLLAADAGRQSQLQKYTLDSLNDYRNHLGGIVNQQGQLRQGMTQPYAASIQEREQGINPIITAGADIYKQNQQK